MFPHILFYQILPLKEQSNEIFDPQFFSSLELVKIFSNLVLFLPIYSKFSIEKTDSVQYHTARNSGKYEYLGENETKNETILTHWSVAQACSNDEKNWGSKISLDGPFKSNQRSCL